MLLNAPQATLLLVDIQQRLLPAMAEPQQVVAKAKILLAAARQLNLPVTVSEQYPKGLGRTASDLAVEPNETMEKLSFSCWRDKALKSRFIDFHEHGRALVIVAGLEAHVCVLQTCLDLVNSGFGVFAVADAMSSRHPDSVTLAFERMRHAGVIVLNTEMAVFELLSVAGTPIFKALSGLIR
jgi:nicotinamidase-related amidase